ncbi:hypothetical protein OKA05_06795 [Luteolibacter arcticus]|uniref:Lipoprotein n=1 Tax=Luteolibacter arcticus TaxID=1581411 RepID=A0ABT3GGW0_9BACT|nr:hypothetical protein [Luteolibacter arcticus]MCW1922254.1 hypothetical protein [Luteolibacter arcticus]
MKRALPYLGAALLALFTSSCLEHTSTIKLNKDGSGTITEETLFSAEASAKMAEMPAGGENPAGKFSDEKKAAETAAKMGEGVTVEKTENVKKDGRIGGRVVYKFKDINKVKFNFGDAMSDAGKDMGPPGDAPDAGEADKPKSKPITFTYKDGVLTLVNPEAKADAKKADGEKGAAPDKETDPQAMAMMQQMFKDMRMSLHLEIVDGIAETNASHVEGNVVTLIDLPFGKLIADPENMKKLEAMKDASPADAAAAFKDIPGLKIETKEEITVKVK